MAAVEKACGGVEETAKQIARTGFKVALMSFKEPHSSITSLPHKNISSIELQFYIGAM